MKKNRFSTQTMLVVLTATLTLAIGTAVLAQQAPATGGAMPAVDATSTPADATTRPAGIAPKQQAMQYLQLGREALNAGDVQKASHWAAQASTLAADYQPGEDSPERLMADIQRAGTPAAVMANTAPAVGAAADASRKSVGKRNKLLIEARVALAAGDTQRATQLANEAAAMNVPYGPNDDTHQNVLNHINNYAAVNTLRQSEGDSQNVRRMLSKSYLEQAQMLLGWGRFDESASLATAASQLGVPYNQFEMQPKDLLARIETAKAQKLAKQGGAPAAAPVTAPAVAQSAAYNTGSDTTQNVQVQATAPAAGSVGYSLLQQAQIALQQGNQTQARQILAQAEQYRGELDAANAQRLTDLQTLLNQGATAAQPNPATRPIATSEQSALFGQLVTELENTTQKAKHMRETDPMAGLKLLKEFKTKVEGANLADGQREMILRSLKSKTDELEKYIEENRSDIELEQQNLAAEEGVRKDYERKHEHDLKLQQMAEEFNQLIAENRTAEAEVIGKRARELYPQDSFAIQLDTMGKMLHRRAVNEKNRSDKEDAIVKAWQDVDAASTPFNKDIEYAKDWSDITKRREKFRKKETRYNERELEILKRLDTPVQAKFNNQSLQAVMETLGKMTGISIHLAPDGLSEQGVAPSQLVTLNTQSEISLKSALHLLLDPLNLDFVIKNEVLMITSKSMKDTDVYTVTYPVADLVIPIPNFAPSSTIGLEGALRRAISANNSTAPWASNMMTPAVALAQHVNGDAAMDPAALSQVNVPIGGASTGNGLGGGTMGGGFGGSMPNTPGGAQSADFDSLIDLIQNTVARDSWDGDGPGIEPFPVNLSLVVSQTQEVHEQITNLLEQLRRMQDLQVTIEVRFITLNDSFFERIGVDFNVNINSELPRDGHSTTAGLSSLGEATNQIQLIQGSSALALPKYGDYDSTQNAGAQFGFSILSDVEAYLFLEAAQSMERSNVLEAPKVTLFNGQQAYVGDIAEQPFVVSVTPVVGDFAAALQPVIVVLSEGTSMTVQAVVSADRRYVRLTVVPYFSQIGDVQEFTFTGTSDTSTDTSSTGNQKDPDDATSSSSSTKTSRSGTTVQLPTFAYVTVTTTVSVPDGGTILLGGIKRLSEGRTEKGVPILNKVPFINRLFKNTGIGRETSSLMMMVTPRIIIQEEEEEQIGVTP